MKQHKVKSHDGYELIYGTSQIKPDKPWLALIIPFGLKLEMAAGFFEFFDPHYNVVSWQSRSILDAENRLVVDGELAFENHVQDIKTIVDCLPAEKVSIVGYCSGAGLALGAANRYPNIIERMILVHGEYVMIESDNMTTKFSMEIDSLLSLAAKSETYLSAIFEKIKGERVDHDAGRPEGIDLPFTQIQYLRRYAANYLCYKSVDFCALAQEVKHDTFIMSGDKDVQANVASSQKIKDLIKGSSIFVDPGADHYGVLRQDSQTMVSIWNYLYDQRSVSA